MNRHRLAPELRLLNRLVSTNDTLVQVAVSAMGQAARSVVDAGSASPLLRSWSSALRTRRLTALAANAQEFGFALVPADPDP